MNLLIALERARTEEDVKDAYIAALGLKSYSKNLVDIQTQEIWFEAKDGPTPAMAFDPPRETDPAAFTKRYEKVLAAVMYATAIGDLEKLGFIGNEAVVEPNE